MYLDDVCAEAKLFRKAKRDRKYVKVTFPNMIYSHFRLCVA